MEMRKIIESIRAVEEQITALEEAEDEVCKCKQTALSKRVAYQGSKGTSQEKRFRKDYIKAKDDYNKAKTRRDHLKTGEI